MKVNERGSDPKLKEAIEEIKATLRKYDAMGAVILVSPSHSEYLNHIQASWSAMSFEEKDGSQGIRFKSKRADYPSKEAQEFATSSSCHALTTIVEWTRKTHDAYRSVLKQLNKHMTIVWETWE